MAEYIEREATCGDCIHADVCERNPNLKLFDRTNPAYCGKFLDAADVIEVGSCDGCHWKGMGRFQKCTYCRRNRNLKDRFEERRGEGG